MATVPCRPNTRHGRAVPARHCDGPRRAAVLVVPCLAVLWARGATHDTAHGPFTRVVPPMGHGHFHCVVPAHGTPCVFNKITYLHTMIQTYQVQSKQQKSKFYEIDYYQKEMCAMLPH
jgi:hypothetical protein